MLKISQKAQKLTTSPLYAFFRKVKELEAQGKEIISLGVGQPYQDTPEEIKQSGIDAIKTNKTYYNPASGSLELKKAIAEKYGVGVNQVSVSSGAKPFLAFTFMALLDEGDVVMMAGPYYPPFAQIVESCGGEVCLIDTKPDGFMMTLEAVKSAAEKYQDSNQKLHLLLNSPNNPTGIIYDKTELKKIVDWCVEKNIVVVSDECYSNFSSERGFSLREFSQDIIVINSFSKTYAMTGWRVGYIICPEEFNVIIGRYLDNFLGCACSISDAAANTALQTNPLDDFAQQRKIMHKWLDEMKIPYSPSTGGIFIFPDFEPVMRKKNIANSVDLATYFLENAGVATTPGVSFGEKYDTHLRISYCVRMEDLKAALEKMEKVILS